ncbi:hypothetical protein GCM10027443_10030 [Pontibacter brevis]
MPPPSATGTLEADSSSTLNATPAIRKNSVKVNLSSLVLNTYSLSYERSLARKVSVVAGYSIMPRTTLSDMAAARYIADKYIANDVVTADLANIEVSNQAFTGEARLYGGKHSGARGFYVSAYGRYMRMQVDYLDTYQSVANKKYQIPYQNTLHGYGGGLMFGAQWLIGKKVNLDWYILGAHYGKLTGDIVAVTNFNGMTQAEKTGLEEDIEHYVRLDGRVRVDTRLCQFKTAFAFLFRLGELYVHRVFFFPIKRREKITTNGYCSSDNINRNLHNSF